MAKRDIKIKIWPEVTGYIPALIPFSSLNSKKNIGNNFLIDLDNCSVVDSSGLNILLIQLLQLSNILGNSREWEFYPTTITKPIDKIQQLGFFEKLNAYSNAEKSLFSIQNFSSQNQEPIYEEINSGEFQKSYPIFSIKIPGEDQIKRRKAILGDLRSWCYDTLFDLQERYRFNLINLIDVITEIAKNTADHTNSDLFLGLDTEEDRNGEYLRIKFSAGDIGEGLNSNIKSTVKKLKGTKHEKKMAKRLIYWDLTQTYRWALERGNTTKFDSIQNKGIGMASMLDSSRKTPMTLSVFDAKSRGLLSNIDPFSLSHSKVRKQFNYIGKAVGFYYYGEVMAKKR